MSSVLLPIYTSSRIAAASSRFKDAHMEDLLCIHNMVIFEFVFAGIFVNRLCVCSAECRYPTHFSS